MPKLILLNKIEKTPSWAAGCVGGRYAVQSQAAAHGCAFASAAAAVEGQWNMLGRLLHSDSATLITSLSSFARESKYVVAV